MGEVKYVVLFWYLRLGVAISNWNYAILFVSERFNTSVLTTPPIDGSSLEKNDGKMSVLSLQRNL